MLPATRNPSRLAAAAAALALLTAPAAVAQPPMVPHSSDLILPLPEVQAIIGPRGPELAVKTINDRTSPWVDHSEDPQLSVPCRHFFNQDEAFGNTWVNYRSAGYGGSSNIGIHQQIAVYPDAATAQRVFQAEKTAAQQCRTHFPTGLNGLPYTLTEQDPHTLLAQFPGNDDGPGSVDIDALRGQIIIGVGAAHFGTDPTIAKAVLAHITHNIA